MAALALASLGLRRRSEQAQALGNLQEALRLARHIAAFAVSGSLAPKVQKRAAKLKDSIGERPNHSNFCVIGIWSNFCQNLFKFARIH